VALGKPTVGAPAALGSPGVVGAPGLAGAPGEVARRIVGAGLPAGGGPAVRRGIVGAGAGGRVGVGGAALSGTVGAEITGGPPGIGGLTGADMGTVAEGTAGGASAALSVTRTVSFFNGTLDVCLEGSGSWFSLSLIRSQVFSCLGAE